ncbi:FMN-binding negative transcriptional regulator [Mucilaginibacter sp. KACC 22063]|uniref:FMN-binding negative transcriptional regulator n=1 Tax=Mucilaginibacter sp. KACC 22063 TaxID=3025666 RepID=UPI002366E26C|nr:FMN-binding negative transcriptional regulator [Mucilaginibacter sp. KACC 22063]WDF53785.1 FMN-binding negative transcriptional regulator [Mucilaginibacter sp. KACC 22063]
MYIPKHFQISDHDEAISFIKKYSFGTLVTIENALPVATHIPFTVRQDGENLILSSHLALANSQSQSLTENKALVIFTEPHAYISPSNYEKQQNVPTWNYIAVHAYGDITIVNDEQQKLTMLEEMIASYDANYMQQWNGLSMDYKLKMLKGIVAFELLVTDLQGKKKLSQNRSDQEKQNIISTLNASPHQTDWDIATYMSKEK